MQSLRHRLTHTRVRTQSVTLPLPTAFFGYEWWKYKMIKLLSSLRSFIERSIECYRAHPKPSSDLILVAATVTTKHAKNLRKRCSYQHAQLQHLATHNRRDGNWADWTGKLHRDVIVLWEVRREHDNSCSGNLLSYPESDQLSQNTKGRIVAIKPKAVV